MEKPASSERGILNEITQVAMKPVGTGLDAGVNYGAGRATHISLVVIGANCDLLQGVGIRKWGRGSIELVIVVIATFDAEAIGQRASAIYYQAFTSDT